MNICTPMRQETTMEIVPQRHRARASAAESMSWNLAWATAMFFSGGIIKDYGYDTSLYIAFTCYLVSAALYYRFFHPWEKLKKRLQVAASKPIISS